jgi:hypothetical protein
MPSLETRDLFLKLVLLIKTAPLRSVLAFMLLLPLLLFALAFTFIIAGYLLDFLLTFLLYGLSGLASDNPRHLVLNHVTWLAKVCWSAMTFMTFGEGVSLFLIFPYAFAAFWLLGSASRDLLKRYPDRPLIFRWFEENKKSLMANDYSQELSYWRADEIVQSYADVLAKGGRGRIADASLLPYDKETIRAAIDRFIESLIEQHGGQNVRPTAELEKIIGTLGAIKWGLFDFQDIDPEDKEAVTILNSFKDFSRPESVQESDWNEFLMWQSLLSSKYSRRVRIEIERLAAGDKTVTVQAKESRETNQSSDPLNPSHTGGSEMMDATSPTWEEVIAEVNRRVEESRADDPRSWEEIVAEGKRRWEKIKTKGQVSQ